MYGEDGWCRSCGVPRGPQIGSLVLERRGMGSVDGAWVPNWHFDVLCLDRDLADEAGRRFNVDLRELEWRGQPVARAVQMVIPTVGDFWFEPAELRTMTEKQHGVAGATCSACGVWRWMPLPLSLLPPLRLSPEFGDDVDIAASPEWFGDGWNAYREILVRRELAELMVAASPKDLEIVPVEDRRVDVGRPWWRAVSGWRGTSG